MSNRKDRKEFIKFLKDIQLKNKEYSKYIKNPEEEGSSKVMSTIRLEMMRFLLENMMDYKYIRKGFIHEDVYRNCSDHKVLIGAYIGEINGEITRHYTNDLKSTQVQEGRVVFKMKGELGREEDRKRILISIYKTELLISNVINTLIEIMLERNKR